MPRRSRRSYSPPPRVAAAAGRTPPSGRGRPFGRPSAASPRRDRRLDRRLDHRRASRKRSRRSRSRRRRGTSSGRRVSRAHARSARVARGSRSRRSKRPAPACRARAGSWRGREEGTRRGQTGRRWANPGGDARWRGRRSRERRAGSSVGGRTSRIVARSKGALAPPRRARRDAPSLKGRAHRSEDVALFSRKAFSCPDGPSSPDRASVSPNASHIGLFSHFCDRSPWRRQSTGAPRRRAPTSRGRSAIC